MYGSGWRYATEEEWINRPDKNNFGSELDFKCAANVFDPVYNKCSYVSDPVRIPDGGWNSLWLVCADDMSKLRSSKNNFLDY